MVPDIAALKQQLLHMMQAILIHIHHMIDILHYTLCHKFKSTENVVPIKIWPMNNATYSCALVKTHCRLSAGELYSRLS